MTSAAARFVVLCARESVPGRDDALRSAARDITDWRVVVDLAAAHGVTAYVRAATHERIALEPQDAELLEATDLAEVAATIALDAELRRILADLAKRGIPVIVLKGPVLARRTYRDRSFRPYHDLDLVVHGEDLGRAAQAIGSLDYVEIPYEAEQARLAHHAAGAEEPFHRLFVARRNGALAELHADPLQLGLRPAAEEDRWRRAVEFPELGSGALALSPADELLQLCVHAHKHGFSRLIWLKDLDLYVRGGAGLDWALIADVARREGVGASLWYALSLATQLLGTPSTVAERLAPSLPIRLLYEGVWPRSAVASLEATMHRRAVQFHVAESWRGMVPTLVLMGRRRDRLRLLIRSLRGSTESQPRPNGRGT